MRKRFFVGLLTALILFCSACNTSSINKDDNSYSNLNTSSNSISESSVTTTTIATSPTASKNYIDQFVENYNSATDTHIKNCKSFDPQDKESGYYRTEYRLSAWDDSVGSVATIGAAKIEMVNYGQFASYKDFRVYVSADTPEEILAIFPTMARVLDSSITDVDIQDIIDHVNEYGDKNGLILGKIDGYILSHQSYCEMMLDISL